MNFPDVNELYKVVFTEYPEIVSVKQMQSMLGISRHESYALINNGMIPGIKIGNAYRIIKFNILKFMVEEPSKSFKPTIIKEYKKARRDRDNIYSLTGKETP